MINEAKGHHTKESDLTISIAFNGTEKMLEKVDKQVEEIFAGCHKFPEEEAKEEWKERYRIGLAFKKLGPSLMAQDFRVPLDSLKETLQELAAVCEGDRWGAESLGGENNSVILVLLKWAGIFLVLLLVSPPILLRILQAILSHLSWDL